MMEHKLGNRLLASLPPADFDLLAPHFRKVSLDRYAVLVRSGDRIEQIYFPAAARFRSCRTCRTDKPLQRR